MKDSILKDLEIYYAVEILKGNIKIEYNKEDYELLGIYGIDERLKVKVNVGLYVYKDSDNGFKK